MQQLTRSFNVPATIRCPHCNERFPITESLTIHNLRGATITCSNCHGPLNWWEVNRNEITENFMLNQAFAPIGARTTVFQLTLSAGRQLAYRFDQYGIPADARILYINYTPQGENGGALSPVEMHGNISTRTFRGNEVVVFPVPVGPHPPESNEVSVMVTWMPSSENDAGWLALVSAFEAYVAEKYDAAIIPANVAVESALSRFMSSYLVNHKVSKSRADEFLVSAATYSHQLNVLLPLVTSLSGLPVLSDQIRGALNLLRDLRNQIAHHGATKKPLTKQVVAEVLTASLFGLRYVQLLEHEATLNAR